MSGQFTNSQSADGAYLTCISTFLLSSLFKMGENVQGTFVSEKISKIRWQHGDFTEAKNFLTGSWDNPVRFGHT